MSKALAAERAWQFAQKSCAPSIAGGREAIRAASPVPYGLDISSGVETNGVKDKKKILEICAKSRAEMR